MREGVPYRAGRQEFSDSDPDPESADAYSVGNYGTAKGTALSQEYSKQFNGNPEDCKVTPEDRLCPFFPFIIPLKTPWHAAHIVQRSIGCLLRSLKYVTKNFVEAQATVLIGVPLIFESIYNKIWEETEKTNWRSLKKGN